MNSKNLLYLIVFDAVLILLTLGLFVYRYRFLSPAAEGAPGVRAAMPERAAAEKPKETAVVTTAMEKPPATRNIAFVYRNSMVRSVEIIGDFNGWIPQSMTKGADHRWTINLAIAPGEYAYNFVVDGRPLRDPNNPKNCNVGRGFENSFLKVRSLSDEKKKQT